MYGMPGSLRSVVAGFVLLLSSTGGYGRPCAFAETASGSQRINIQASTLTFTFDRSALDHLGMTVIADGNLEDVADGLQATFAVDRSSKLEVQVRGGVYAGLASGRAGTRGAFLIRTDRYRDVIGTLTLMVDEAGLATIVAAPDAPGGGTTVFDIQSIVADLDRSSGTILLSGELAITDSWAAALSAPGAAGLPIGMLWLDASSATPTVLAKVKGQTSKVESQKSGKGPFRPSTFDLRPSTFRSVGSDVIVADLQSVGRYGREGDITAYAVGTHACNLGDEEANWIKNTNQHPVIVQNMYRLKGDKMEQIGLSWVKHGFYAVSFDLCGPCNDPTPEGSHLAVGCSDPYSASLNGVQGNMSPTSTVNAHTGYFPYPWSGWSESEMLSPIDRRLQVHDADLDPALNEGAVYFVQGQYVMADDAANGTHDNNASYREVAVTNPQDGVYKVSVTDSAFTQRGQPAVRAWQDQDPSVEETDVRVPGEGLFILAAKAIALDTGLWRYSYALENLNSDRSARLFQVPLPGGAVVSNVGFHDVDYHSGEPYDLTDWPGTTTDGAVTWSTLTYDENENANALRFGTLYTFYFDVNIAPAATTVTIGLFKPGFPSQVTATIVGPALRFIDCNANGIMDICDVDCHPTDASNRPLVGYCAVPDGLLCGMSADCNGNWVPDECEPDCNENGIADSCDITDASSTDCNGNGVPDDCEPDCDGNGVADDCETLADRDGDGIADCFDRCPVTTPPQTCQCPEFGTCCFPPELGGACTPELVSPEVCLSFGAIPGCLEKPCRQGCLIGDYDGDGDLDLADAGAYQRCISLDVDDPAYVAPVQECSIPLDFDNDDDVDIADVATFLSLMTGPVQAPP